MRRRGWLNYNEDVATSSVHLDARIICTKAADGVSTRSQSGDPNSAGMSFAAGPQRPDWR